MTADPTPSKRPYVVIAVINEEARLNAVLKALARRGHGATFLNSVGFGRLQKVSGTDMPIIASLAQIFQTRQDLNVTLMSVVEGENAVWDVIAAIEGEVGDLDQPHTGIAFAVPISHLTGYLHYMPGDLGEQG